MKSPVEHAMQIALQHHQAGRLQQAEQIYRQTLAQQPDHFEALHYLGMIAVQVRRNDLAVELIRRAVALRPNWPEAHSNLGVALQDRGHLDEAINAYRRAIALRPNFPETYYNLGTALNDKGHLDEAIAAYRQAIALRPGYAEAHCNFGIALKRKGHLEEAMAACRQAIALKPDLPEAHSNLGNALQEKGQLDDAIAACRRAIALRPGYAEAHSTLGAALRDKGLLDEAIAACRQAIALRPGYAQAHSALGVALKDKGYLDEAIAACRQAIALNPDFPEAHINLGNALRGKGSMDQAIAAYRQAIALWPDYAEAHSNLGSALEEKGQLDEAIAAYGRATALNPNFPEAHYNLGIALQGKGQLDKAIAAYRQAITLRPGYFQACNNLGHALEQKGQLDEAIAAYRRAIALEPDSPKAHSNLVLTLHYHPGVDARTIADEHRRWARKHAEPLGRSVQPHLNDRSPDRRLRIGYVSPDFKQHAVAPMVLPLLECHDREKFQVFCYAQVDKPDAMTERFRAQADEWRSTVGLSDEQLAGLICQDQIDILVDLAGHTAGGRLLVFARKPAPVQMARQGYPNTTGLTTIDYRMTDAYADPPGLSDTLHSEQLIRLPQTNWIYQPPENGPAPRLRSAQALEHRPDGGSITFGCFNTFAKVTEPMLVLWGQILKAVPQSRLLLKARGLSSQSMQQRIRELLTKEGIDPARLEMRGWEPEAGGHLALYNRVDIALDPFPYHGTTTTCEALWMGVPVITLAGRTHVSRVGVSLLTNMGLAELIAESPQAYETIAVELARDVPRLRSLHSTLRQRMEQSPLMDAPRFARNVEAVYRQVWRRWCGEAPETQ